ncbi:MAG TPA: DUF481 domain-containing protein [Silvibacterium sp.]|nr:DUF481 domain-containing protein [Silvibacterium sp.]
MNSLTLHTIFLPRRVLSAVVPFLLFSFGFERGFSAPAPPTPDVLVFTNGDQLTGKLLRSAGGSVVFHSDMAGDLTIDWAKVKEIRTPQQFAVIEKGVKPSRKTPEAQVPHGTVTIADQSVEVHTVSGAIIPPIPVKNIDFLIDQPTYQSKVETAPNFFHAWHGTGTFGSTIVEATQKTYTYNWGLALVRTVPDVSWLAPRNRMTGDFTGSYGKITDPAYTIPASAGPPPTPATYVPETEVKTSIIHGDFERDEYVSERFYFLGALALDHNYSQSLQLQQIYGGGIGYTIIKEPKQTLDLKALIQYEKQEFINPLPGENQDLVGSTFSANYLRHLPHGILFNQQFAYIPAWNNLHAYSVTELDTFSIPAYKRLSMTLGTLDSYLNNPATTLPPTKRNSFQFTAGVTYAFK